MLKAWFIYTVTMSIQFDKTFMSGNSSLHANQRLGIEQINCTCEGYVSYVNTAAQLLVGSELGNTECEYGSMPGECIQEP